MKVLIIQNMQKQQIQISKFLEESFFVHNLILFLVWKSIGFPYIYIYIYIL